MAITRMASPGPASLVRACLAAFAWAALAHSTSAATIDTERTTTCDVHLSGDIDAGDADKLLTAIQAVDQQSAPGPRPRLEYELEQNMFVPRLCLNSKGGRFDEAMKFIRATLKQVSFVTVVESGAECYSACALIFLAGHFNEGDGYFELYRRLHVNAQLGFHAPYIPAVGAGASDKLLSASYRAGVTAVGELLNLDGKFFPRSLLAEFLKVGPENFFRIDKVGQLAAWDVVLTGYKRSASVYSRQIANVCNNQRLRDNGDVYYAPMLLWNIDEPDPGKGMQIPVGGKILERFEGSIEGVSGCTVTMRMHEGILFMRADTLGEKAGDPNQEPWKRDTFISANAASNVGAIDADGYTPGYYLYPANTKIVSLARAD